MIKSAEIVCPEKKHLFANISLSDKTISERINEISNNLQNQLNVIVNNCESFSLVIDESIDIKDISQFAVFIRAVDTNFKTNTELLKLIAMKDTTKGEDLLLKLFNLINDLKYDWRKLVSITSDGAPAMSGKEKGLIALLKRKLIGININHKVINYHCIIHQESLCAKILKYENVMKIVVKTINFIRSRGLNHRQFQKFLIELNSHYSEVTYFSEVRWLSRGIVLQRFFELRNEIDLFMKEKGKCVSEISNINWICDLAFLADITSHLNELNLKLQGKDRFVTELYDSIKAFQLKLMLFKSQIKSKDFSHFKCCEAINRENKVEWNIEKYISSLKSLKAEFNERFYDFKNYKFNFALFTNPFAIEISETLKSFLNGINRITIRFTFSQNIPKMILKNFIVFSYKDIN
jgi:hypothetical protein